MSIKPFSPPIDPETVYQFLRTAGWEDQIELDQEGHAVARLQNGEQIPLSQIRDRNQLAELIAQM